MKFSRKITSVLLTLSLVIGASITAFASANGDVIQALKDAKVPATYITQAQNYLSTVTLTDVQAAAIKADIKTASDTLNAAGTHDITALTTAQRTTIINAITDAGKVINLTVTVVRQSNGSLLVTANKADGATAVTFTSSEVKQTGASNLTLAAGAFLIILSAGSVFVVRKAKHN